MAKGQTSYARRKTPANESWLDLWPPKPVRWESTFHSKGKKKITYTFANLSLQKEQDKFLDRVNLQ